MFYIISPVCLDRAFIFYKNILPISSLYTFSKNDKLKSRKLIEHLFSKGKSVSAFPVKVLYDFVESTESPIKTGVTVGSKIFKKAFQRNRVKRILREAFRLQKLPLQKLLETSGKGIALFFIYTGKEMPVYKEVHEKIGTLLKRIADTIPGED